MNYPEPSKEVKELLLLQQDLYEIKRIQASLSQLPEGNLKATLAERVASLLTTGTSISDLEKVILQHQKESLALESRIAELEQVIAELSDGRDPVPEVHVYGLRLRWTLLASITFYVIGYVYGSSLLN